MATRLSHTALRTHRAPTHRHEEHTTPTEQERGAHARPSPRHSTPSPGALGFVRLHQVEAEGLTGADVPLGFGVLWGLDIDRPHEEFVKWPHEEPDELAERVGRALRCEAKEKIPAQTEEHARDDAISPKDVLQAESRDPAEERQGIAEEADEQVSEPARQGNVLPVALEERRLPDLPHDEEEVDVEWNQEEVVLVQRDPGLGPWRLADDVDAHRVTIAARLRDGGEVGHVRRDAAKAGVA